MERQRNCVSQCVDLCPACVGEVKGQLFLGLPALVPHRPTKENPPSPPEGRPTTLLAVSLPSLERSSAQGVSAVRWELGSFRSLFFPAVRCRLPPVGCLEVGHLRFRPVGRVGSPPAPTSGCAQSTPLSRGRAAPRRPEDLLRCAAPPPPCGRGQRHDPANGARASGAGAGTSPRGVGTRALPSRRPRVWSRRSHQFSLSSRTSAAFSGARFLVYYKVQLKLPLKGGWWGLS